MSESHGEHASITAFTSLDAAAAAARMGATADAQNTNAPAGSTDYFHVNNRSVSKAEAGKDDGNSTDDTDTVGTNSAPTPPAMDTEPTSAAPGPTAIVTLVPIGTITSPALSAAGAPVSRAPSSGAQRPKHTQFLDLTNGKGGALPPANSHDSNAADARLTGARHSIENDPVRSYIAQHVYDQDQDLRMTDVTTRNEPATTTSMAPAISKQKRRHNRKRLPHASKHQGGDEEGGGGGGGGGLTVSISASTTGGTNSSGRPYHASNPKFDPNTPGKVVETGHEQTGRWTQEEHNKFLMALNMYGKEWKKVAAKVKTRTVVQTRTHAQKYFQKLQKAKQSGEEVASVQMGTAVPAGLGQPNDNGGLSIASPNKRMKKSGGSSQKKSPGSAEPAVPISKYTPVSIAKNPPKVLTGLTTANSLGIPVVVPSRSHLSPHRQSSVTSAAQLISNLAGSTSSKVKPSSAGPAPAAPAVGAGTTFQLSTQASAFSTAPAADASKTYPPSTAGQHRTPNFGISIVAPDATSSLRRNPFPEPSPAACGKRKIAEIAAAKLLAGVASSTSSGNGGFFSLARTREERAGAHKTAMAHSSSISQRAANILKSADAGAATPPPISTSSAAPAVIKPDSSAGANQVAAPRSSSAASTNVTPPRAVTQPDDTSGRQVASSSQPVSATPVKSAPALSLQIVNPESLGVTYNTGRSKSGGDSPVTPWEGQLQALIDEEKKHKGDKNSDEENGMAVGLPKMPSVGGGATGAGQLDLEESSPPAESEAPILHPVVGLSTTLGRSRIHKAVCEMDSAAIQIGLSLNSDHLERKDEAGYVPLHSAAALNLKQPGGNRVSTGPSDICRILLSAGADSSTRDKHGNTPLHWACRAGDPHAAVLLLQSGPRDAKNNNGETPLHWAMRAGRRSSKVVQVLLENGARPTVLNKSFRRPIDIAADGFDDEGVVASSSSSSTGGPSRPTMNVMELKLLAQKRKRLTKEQRAVLKQASVDRRFARATHFNASTNSRTLVLHHPECLEHIPKALSDWECPARVTTILDRILKCGTDRDGLPIGILPHELNISQEFEKAKVDLLNRVHSTEYLKFVNRLSADLESQAKKQLHSQQQLLQQRENGSDEDSAGGSGSITPPVVPFTPMVQKSMSRISESRVKLGQHSDTSFSAGSLNAARRAAGAVQHAVDRVLVGRNRNAFCIVRPPGHHAGVNGLLDGGESCGFCIFNNVAAGAMHAISDERLLCERCAIVDIDIHHGNGTEEIVRKCHDPSKLFFFSIHLYDNDRKGKRETKSFQYKFYPGTGDEDDVAMNIINVPIMPMWKEPATATTPATRSSHNTRQKTRKRTVDDKTDGDVSSDAGTPRASDVESIPNEATSLRSATTSPVPPGVSGNGGNGPNSGRVAYRNAIQSRLLPALRAFNPDLILISAGFDASRDDVGNAKHEVNRERRGMDLEPEDYAWTTRKILEIADICCQGRVVSVLEGGYGRTPQTQSSSAAHGQNALDKAVLGDCALRHLHAMIDPYDVERRFPSSL